MYIREWKCEEKQFFPITFNKTNKGYILIYRERRRGKPDYKHKPY